MKFLSAIFLSLFMCLSATYAMGDIVLTPKNTITLRGPVNTPSVTEVSYKLLTHKGKGPLYLFIDSPGGSIDAGLQLVHVIKNMPKDKKLTCITNFGASMAFIITQACPERVVLPHSILMQHVASYGVRGNEPNNYSIAKFIRRMVKKLVVMQAKRIGMSAKKFYNKTRDDWWLYGDESVKWKVADRVEENVSCTQELTKKTEKISVRSLFFSVKLAFSGCPLIRGTVSANAKQLAGFNTKEASQELVDIMSWYQPEGYMSILQSKEKKLKDIHTIRIK